MKLIATTIDRHFLENYWAVTKTFAFRGQAVKCLNTKSGVIQTSGSVDIAFTRGGERRRRLSTEHIGYMHLGMHNKSRFIVMVGWSVQNVCCTYQWGETRFKPNSDGKTDGQPNGRTTIIVSQPNFEWSQKTLRFGSLLHCWHFQLFCIIRADLIL